MARKRKKRRKLCPEGVTKGCMYCVELVGDVWHILDPKGTTIDEASDEKEAMTIADGYVSECIASKSGYGKKVEFKKNGKIRWERHGK